MTQKKASPKDREVVTLADLAPRHRIVGGSHGSPRTVFGANPVGSPQEDAMKKTAKDLSPKTTKVKGGGQNLNDNMTLVRGAKPARKDLSARTAKVKSDRLSANDNMTLVRPARPAKNVRWPNVRW